MSSRVILEGVGLTKRFGKLTALKGVDLKLNEKEIVGLVGPNGSGKTTLINVVTGFYKPDEGRVLYLGQDVTGMPPFKLCKLGVARTFQIPRALSTLTVFENVKVSALYCGHGKVADDAILEVLELLNLKHKRDALAGSLNVTEKKLLEIARTLITRPKVLFIDEPFCGLSPEEIRKYRYLLLDIRRSFDVTIVWVEHLPKALRGIVDRVVVLDSGEKIAEGSFEEVFSNEKVVQAYLGKTLIE